MTHFKELLTAQRDALTKDINIIKNEIEGFEAMLTQTKTRKSLAVKELKSIEKKLSKIS